MRYLLNAKLNVNIIAMKTIINKYRVNFITMVLSNILQYILLILGLQSAQPQLLHQLELQNKLLFSYSSFSKSLST